MQGSIASRLVLAAALALTATACREEGPAEKAGRKMDEAFDKLRHGDEGAVERAGRKLDEAIEDAGDEIEDTVDDLREEAADAIEGR
jgi:hypothetical protein